MLIRTYLCKLNKNELKRFVCISKNTLDNSEENITCSFNFSLNELIFKQITPESVNCQDT